MSANQIRAIILIGAIITGGAAWAYMPGDATAIVAACFGIAFAAIVIPLGTEEA